MQLTTLGALLEWASQTFEESGLYFGHGTNNAWDEAVVLARHVLNLPIDVEYSAIARPVSPAEQRSFSALVERRVSERIPAAYLVQEAWFANLRFYVDQRVIIPRSPIAECIMNRFQPWWCARPIQRILDLCTGSGCIAIACAMLFDDAEIDAIDVSEDALAVARKNIALHRCETRVNLVASDLFAACPEKKYDIIISNPPYVSTKEMQEFPTEYAWEPKIALEAGQYGLDIVNRIFQEAPKFLANRGLLCVEVGNAREALQRQRPELPLTWLDFQQGGEGVFLLSVEGKAWSAVF